MCIKLKRVISLIFIIICINTLVASADYVGSSKSSIYHYRECEWAAKVNPANLVVFKDAEEAQKKGFRSCKVCFPPESGKINRIWLSNPPQNLNVGDFAELKWEYSPQNPEDKKDVKIKVENTDVITLSRGKVYAKAIGSSDIVATTPSGVCYTYTLHVVPVPVKRVRVENPPKTVMQFKTFCPKVKVEPANTDYKDVTWKTSDKSVVKITRDGKLKAVGAGRCTLTAVCGGKTADFEIDVKSNYLVWGIPFCIVLAVAVFVVLKKKKLKSTY